MEALLQTLVMKYGYPYAAKLLGIDKQQANPKYTFGMPFTNNKVNINPIRMIANQGMKSMMGGSSGSGIFAKGIPLLAGALALGYYTNPLREGSYNYNPNLQGQIDYLNKNNMINRNNSSGLLKYGDDSILSGQGVVSGFGTNDYIGQLEKYKDKYYDTMSEKRKTKLDKELKNARQDELMQEVTEEEKTRNRKNYVAPHHGNVHDTSGNNDYGSATQSGGFDPGGFEQDGTGRQGYGRGGIASL